jgi:hypothetical protein
MATIFNNLKKITELYVPRAGDEQEFVAKHTVKTYDFQGKDSISQESPYDHILKNVAAVKAPPHAGQDHGHDAPGESEAAYHIPESRDSKIAKLSEMMGKDEDEDEEDDEEDEEEEEDENVKEAMDVVGVKMHYHNPKTNEKFHEIHFTVPAAERLKKQHEKSGFKLVKKQAMTKKDMKNMAEGSKMARHDKLAKALKPKNQQELDFIQKYKADLAKSYLPKKTQGVAEEAKQVDEAAKGPLHVVHVSFTNLAAVGPHRSTMNYKVHAPDKEAAKRYAERDLKHKSRSGLKAHSARLVKEEAEQIDELKKSTLASYIGKAAGRLAASSRLQRDFEKDGHTEIAGEFQRQARKKRSGIEKAANKLAKEEVEQVDEMMPLLPKQKQIAKDLLKKEMEDRKKQRNDNRQAGTPKLSESDNTDQRVATPRANAPRGVEGLRHRLQTIKKQVINKT